MLRISTVARAALPALAATAMVTGLASSAQAGGPWPYHHHHSGYSVGAGLVTGLAVGALVGSAIAAPYAYGPPVVYGPPAVAYIPPPPPQPYCYQTTQRYWTPYGWQYQPVTVCN